jgi:hypothetical protein
MTITGSALGVEQLAIYAPSTRGRPSYRGRVSQQMAALLPTNRRDRPPVAQDAGGIDHRYVAKR